MLEHVDRSGVVALTQDLVRIDTRNPPGNERPAADLCREVLAGWDATFEEVEPAPDRTSLIARIGDLGPDRPTLIVNGHLDVVPVHPRDWTRDPFGGEVDGDRLYGRGSADMKGGIAAAIFALDALRRAGREPACSLVFHLVADEELGGPLGTQVVVERGHVSGAAACLIPEPTGLQVGVAERGLLIARITTFGRSAHGSNPRDGISAVETAAKAVLALHAADFGDPAHPLLGTPTANVGEIHGGNSHNTVPDECTIVVGRRLLPGRTEKDELASLEELLDGIGDPDLRYRIDVDLFGEASEMESDHPFATAVRDAVRSVTGEQPPILGMPFTTDARFVRNQAGVPAVVCGPGQLAQAHVSDEWISVDALVRGTAVYATLFATFAG